MERTHALDRWLYQGKHPNRLARLIKAPRGAPLPEFERIAAQCPVFHVAVAEGSHR